jgi:HlyD family secretion protein
MTKKRWFVISAAIAVMLIIVIYGFMPSPASVDAAKAVRGQMQVVVAEEGKTRVKDKFVISAPVSGFMRRISLEVGDAVKNGQIVAELEPLRSAALDPRSRAAAEASVSSASESLKAAQENAQAAKADEEYAKKTFERIKKLYDEGFASKDHLEQAQSEAKRREAYRLSADASVKASAAELERAKTALGYTGAGGGKLVYVASPVSGRVLKIYRKSESALNAGEPLIDIGNPQSLEVRVETLSSDAVKIKPAMTVLFDRWGGDKAIRGKVRIVEPAGFTKVSSLGVEEQRVLVIADIEGDDPAVLSLGDEYRVEARFIIWEKDSILQIPSGALFRDGEEWAVFRVQNGRARLQKVSIGQRNGLTAEITSGLSEGDTVIVHPKDAVKDGKAVKIRK